MNRKDNQELIYLQSQINHLKNALKIYERAVNKLDNSFLETLEKIIKLANSNGSSRAIEYTETVYNNFIDTRKQAHTKYLNDLIGWNS